MNGAMDRNDDLLRHGAFLRAIALRLEHDSRRGDVRIVVPAKAR